MKLKLACLQFAQRHVEMRAGRGGFVSFQYSLKIKVCWFCLS